jgi:hypothetical protein
MGTKSDRTPSTSTATPNQKRAFMAQPAHRRVDW